MTKRLQVRCQYSDTLMHIQGVGEQTVEQGTNIWRPYGMAAEYRIPKELNDWLGMQEPINQSPASGDTLYIPFELFLYAVGDEQIVQVLIRSSPTGTDLLNHPEGAMLNVKPNMQMVNELVKFAQENDLITVVVGEQPYKVEEEEE